MSGKSKQKSGDQGEGHKATKRRPQGVTTTQQRATPEPETLSEKAPIKTRPGSIRQTVMSMITAGNSTEEISEVLKAQFPGTKAAEKAGKHIAHYRSLMKKASREVKA